MGYDMTIPTKCTEITAGATNECRWYQSINPYADQDILGGRVIAYQIQWFNGAWSSWFVPG